MDESDDECGEYLENKSEFVRNGFGRMSTVSGKSSGPGLTFERNIIFNQ